MRLLLALHSIPVVLGILAEVHIPVAEEGSLVTADSLVVAYTPVVDILEVASVAQQS